MTPLITDYTKNGQCSSCGNCCSNLLPLFEGEIRRIKKYIKRHGIKEQRHNYLQGFDMTCPFRNDLKRTCEIYEVRPDICRSFQCNHTEEDIRNTKLSFHEKCKVVYMRSEFFGNKEDEVCVETMLAGQ